MVGAVLGRLLRPTPKRFLQLMRSIGEADTVVRYPDLIAAMVASANDPVAAAADRAELRALIGPSASERQCDFAPISWRRSACRCC